MTDHNPLRAQEKAIAAGMAEAKRAMLVLLTRGANEPEPDLGPPIERAIRVALSVYGEAARAALSEGEGNDA
jgi:hypothetical protein